MKFKALSNEKRRLELDMEKINLYVARYKKFTPFDIEITRRQKTVSDPLRKYYFAAVLPPFMNELGYEPEEELLFHHQLKSVYFSHSTPELEKLGIKVWKDKRGIYRGVPSVFSNKSPLPVSLKKKFVDWVIRKAAQEGVFIEDPS